MTNIIPIILAGGSGTRLWPASRKSYPKQFNQILNSTSLFQQALNRVATSSKLSFENPLVLTSEEYRFIAKQQMEVQGISSAQLILEPEEKNTSPAILAAALHVLEQNKNAIMLVLPSDHIISDVDYFHEAILRGLKLVNKERIVTFGIKPTRAETGYGYIKIEGDPQQQGAHSVSFVEKPEKKIAEEIFKEDNYFWNAGIFLFRASDLISEYKLHCPEVFVSVSYALAEADIDMEHGFCRLGASAWGNLTNQSIDYALMEKTSKLSTVCYESHWSDLGDWASVAIEVQAERSDKGINENTFSVDCENTFLRNLNPASMMVGIGLENIVAVATNDAVLVAAKDRVQEVRQIPALLFSKGLKQATEFPKEHRPWGWFESLALDQKMQVKRICVDSGGILSLQSHKYRSEHWVVVRGTVTVTLDDEVQTLAPGQSVYVPVGAKHRLANHGEVPAEIIEVQTGVYFGEDDIIRYDDVYDRE